MSIECQQILKKDNYFIYYIKNQNANLLQCVFEHFNLKELLSLLNVSKFFRKVALEIKILKIFFSFLSNNKLSFDNLLNNNGSLLNSLVSNEEISYHNKLFTELLLYFLIKRSIKKQKDETFIKLPKSLGEKGCKYLSHVLGKFPIQILDFSFSKIGNNGLNFIIESIKLNNSLRKLNISDNYLGNDGIKQLSENLNKNILILDISNNHFEPNACSYISHYLSKSKIEKLIMSNNKIKFIGMKELFPGLENCMNIKYINLRGNDLEEQSCKIISEFLKLNHSINRLNLSKNKIDAKGMNELVDGLILNDSIKEINLQNNLLDDFCGKVTSRLLIESNSLEKLDLSNNKIKEIGCLEISKGLSFSNQLTHFSISSNDIGNLGASYLLKSLEENNGIKFLDLSSNSLDNDIIENIKCFLEKNKSIETLNICDGEINQISLLSEVIINHISLINLDLSLNQIQDEELILFSNIMNNSNFNKLFNFNFSDNDFSNNIIYYICRLISENKIREIHLNSIPLDQSSIEEICNSFKKSRSLKKIYLSCTNIDNCMVKILLKTIINNSLSLTYVNITKNNFKKSENIKNELIQLKKRNILIEY